MTEVNASSATSDTIFGERISLLGQTLSSMGQRICSNKKLCHSNAMTQLLSYFLMTRSGMGHT